VGDDPKTPVDLCSTSKDLDIELEEITWTKVVNRIKSRKSPNDRSFLEY
jgi:hypothetical protein